MQLELLKKQIKNGIFPHAYLFSGNDTKQKELAVDFIKNEFLRENFYDFFEIIPKEGLISIDDIKILIKKSLQTPFLGEKNIFLIRNIECLGREAEIALLKTLEDSSLNNLFIATSNNVSLIIPTIKSRFSNFRFFSSEGSLSDFKQKGPENLEEIIRNGLIKYTTLFRKNGLSSCIWKTEKLLEIQKFLHISALNRRMVKEYIEMLDYY